MATGKQKKVASKRSSASAKKVTKKKTVTKKATKKKATKTKAAEKKVSKKKVSKKTPTKKVAAATKKAPKKKVAAATKKTAPATKAAKPAKSREKAKTEPAIKVVARKVRPSTSLPPDHEVLPLSRTPPQPADPEIVAQAIRAAFEAKKEHPIAGRDFPGVRSRLDVPVEGDRDFAVAQDAQRAAQEVLAAAERAVAEHEAVQARVDAVYTGQVSLSPVEDSMGQVAADQLPTELPGPATEKKADTVDDRMARAMREDAERNK